MKNNTFQLVLLDNMTSIPIPYENITRNKNDRPHVKIIKLKKFTGHPIFQ
jgi:hypothetical protein